MPANPLFDTSARFIVTPDNDRFKIDTVKSYLRRKYPATDSSSLATLKTLADSVFSEATDTVTITSAAAEGGSQSFQLNFPKTSYLAAIQELIDEYDPENAAPIGGRVAIPDWSMCQPG